MLYQLSYASPSHPGENFLKSRQKPENNPEDVRTHSRSARSTAQKSRLAQGAVRGKHPAVELARIPCRICGSAALPHQARFPPHGFWLDRTATLRDPASESSYCGTHRGRVAEQNAADPP